MTHTENIKRILEQKGIKSTAITEDSNDLYYLIYSNSNYGVSPILYIQIWETKEFWEYMIRDNFDGDLLDYYQVDIKTGEITNDNKRGTPVSKGEDKAIKRIVQLYQLLSPEARREVLSMFIFMELQLSDLTITDILDMIEDSAPDLVLSTWGIEDVKANDAKPKGAEDLSKAKALELLRMAVSLSEEHVNSTLAIMIAEHRSGNGSTQE